MSTYIDILRAHQRGKLKANEPSQQDSTAALPESTDDASPDELLQEEPASPTSGDDTTPLAADTPPPTPEEQEETSPAGMLPEEAGAPSMTSDAEDAPMAEKALPEEAGNGLLDAAAADGDASEPVLPEEIGAPSSAPDTDDAPMASDPLPEEPGNMRPDADDGMNDTSSEDLLQEETHIAPASDEEALSEEQRNPALDLHEVDEAALASLLQEETAQDLGDIDDALFAQMLQDEPNTPEDDGPQGERHASAGSLADEAPETQPPDTDGVAWENSVHTWLSGCVMLLVRLYEHAAHDTPTDISPLLHHLDQFSAQAHENPEELSSLELDIANRIESIRQAHADNGDLVQKAVMMMLYGFKVCMQMRMESAEITRYVAAAMLHNIGMAQIFLDTRQKEDKLTNAERTLIRRVPEKSVDYLKRCGVSDRVILLAAQQAQERHDGSGPHGLAGADIALSARIAGLLSMFEALVHVRSYRERLLPRDAIRELVNGHKNRFDPAILKNLIESVSLYPVGTYVQLNSGDIGQVIRIQPRLPLRPKIMLSMDRHGNRIQAREVDLQKQPNLMVQRCMYREGLVPMKPEEGEE